MHKNALTGTILKTLHVLCVLKLVSYMRSLYFTTNSDGSLAYAPSLS